MSSQFEYQHLTKESYLAAQKIVPLVADIVGLPQRVLDLGGGAGGWLKAFQEAGAQRITLVDHPHLKPEDLLIPFELFTPCDLEKELPSLIKCDLAISIECLEHLPAKRTAAILDFLTQSSDVVLFSAAIPGQGGHRHINEQRASYWKREFALRNFRQLDAVRPQILFDASVPWWLRQNLFLYVNTTAWNKLSSHWQSHQFMPDDFALVYSQIFEPPSTFRQLLRQIWPATQQAIRNRLQNSK